MSERSLLGRLGSWRPPGRTDHPEALCAALDPNTAATAHRAEPLVVAALPATGSTPGTDRTLCLLDGSIVNLSVLAASLDLDRAIPPEELLARGFEKVGEAVTERLTGSYVLLFWDRERRQGLIARDPLGARPLFLIGQGRALLFASEIRPILEVLPTRPTVDPVGLAHWLARRREPPELTLFEGLQRLPAGHMVRLTEGGFRVQRWWHPRYRAPAARSRAEAAAELRGEMAAAVRRAAGPADMVGVRLSGGFDSGCVAALASSELNRDRLRAYSVLFPDHSEADESKAISDLRRHLGIEGVERSFHGGSALTAAAQFIAAWAVPPSSPNWFVWRPLIRQAAANGNELLLDGEGGDEVFGCSPYLLADLLMHGRLLALMTMTRQVPGMGLRPGHRRLWRGLKLWALRGALPPRGHMLARRVRERRRAGPSWLAEASFERVLESERPYEWKRLPGPRWWAALIDAQVNVPDALKAADELRREAVMDGVRFAHPWRDPRLVEYMLTQPPELSFHPVHDRALARDSMRGLLPEPIRLNEAKPVFNVMLQESLAGVDGPLAKELLLNPPDELAVHLRRSELPSLLENRGSLLGSLAVWRLATAALWLRNEADPDSLSRFLK